MKRERSTILSRDAHGAAWGGSPADALRAIPQFALLILIRAYQVGLRPLLIGSCKFYPSCSEYGAEAVAVHGAWRGTWLAVRRVLRCHPCSVGGIDPVPATRTARQTRGSHDVTINAPAVDAAGLTD